MDFVKTTGRIQLEQLRYDLYYCANIDSIRCLTRNDLYLGSENKVAFRKLEEEKNEFTGKKRMLLISKSLTYAVDLDPQYLLN